MIRLTIKGSLKLHRLGINSGVFTWIQSFLSNRSQSVVLDGEHSDSCPVLSCVPQGSVLGPCLFLMYINDMPDSIKSNIRLFADGTIMYLTISTQDDCHALQSNLSKLEAWEKEWLMAFNQDKCEVIRITKKKTPFFHDFKLHGLTLKSEKNVKYLGVNISDDLSWTKHINQLTTKGNNTLKFIERNIHTHNRKIKESAFKTYVRPFLGTQHPFGPFGKRNNINQIEIVQHRAVRYTCIFNDYQHTSSITSMLNKLSLPTLEKRRKISSLIMFHKINHRKVRINFPAYVKPTLRNRFSIPYSRILKCPQALFLS